MRGLLLLAVPWLGSAAEADFSSSGSASVSSSASSGSSSGFLLSNATGWCRHRAYADLRDYVVDALGTGATGDKVNQVILKFCDSACPNPSAADFKQECSSTIYHAAYTEWQEEAERIEEFQWSVFFVAFCLLLGALFKQCLPTQIPYTVGILLIFMCLGLLAQGLSDAKDCPYHAW